MGYEINEEMARKAHEMRSFRDYVPGKATADYQKQVANAREIAEQAKSRCKTTAQRNRVDGMLDKYERTLAFAINRENEVGTWCPSVLVVGGANFPVKKKERQTDAWEANLANYNKAAELLERIRSYALNAPVTSRDPEVLAALNKKLEDEKKKHEHMIVVNKHFRQFGTVEGCEGVGPCEQAMIEARMKQWGDRAPFLPWQLSNSTARIHRLEGRIKEVEAAAAANAQPVEVAELPGVTYHENSAQMRVQLIFDGKPEPDIRGILKSHAFRWSPSQGAWQRILNENGKRAARAVLEEIKMLQGGQNDE